MATSSSAILKHTALNGKTFQKSITYINPEVSNDKIAHMATLLNALTNHTYVETVRVDKTVCDAVVNNS